PRRGLESRSPPGRQPSRPASHLATIGPLATPIVLMTAYAAPPVETCPSRRGDASWAAHRGCPGRPRPGSSREAAAVVRHSDVDDPQLPLHDVIQQRYELIRPLVLLQDRTARQRAQETDTHPETVC